MRPTPPELEVVVRIGGVGRGRAHGEQCGRSPRVAGVTRPPAPAAADLAALLPPDIDLRIGQGSRSDAPAEDLEQVWYGVVWGRLGRGDLAWAWWDRVATPSLQPWLAAERGRLLRELGGHRAARALERAALQHADDPLDRVMLEVSLAADAVGQADAEVARRRLASARRGLAALPWSPRRDRQWLRAGWVAVEIGLLAGDRPTAVALPSWRAGGDGPNPAPRTRSMAGVEGLLLPSAYRSASRFHVAKGCLFAGVVRGDRELLGLAAELAPPALLWAVHLAREALGIRGAAASAATARARIVPPPVME